MGDGAICPACALAEIDESIERSVERVERTTRPPPTGANVDPDATADVLRDLADAIDAGDISLEAIEASQRTSGYDQLVTSDLQLEYCLLTTDAADLLDDVISLTEIN